ncbi:glycosyltransferase family 2 protein [Tateyamaria omphalii]|uniref:glycosyltransferase family 2 protein n=1 Tax=Tateyamaria omphalii TaxID=299262 RepID=UPI001E63D347|nr:glycosyltransferase family 2 protein [Tateyamaria omphalii]
MTHHDVTIVTVCHNSLSVLPSMLESIPKGVPVVLVDNASSDTAELQTLAHEHKATLFLNRDNVGFGPACNQGASKSETKFLLFLNPDAALQPGALEGLFEAAKRCPNASAFNPRILDSKSRQSFRRGSKIKPKERLRGPVPTSDTEVSVLAGSAIFCRKALFEKIGGFDPEIFMYHEDDDLSLRLREHGPLMYCHAAKVVHLSGHGSPRSPQIAAFKAYFSARSRVYTLTKYGHPRPKLNTLSSALFRLLSPDTLFLKRKRAKHIGYLKGAFSAFKDGGRHSSYVQT